MIVYGIHPSPFGKCFVALMKKDVCSLLFLEKGGEGAAVRDLQKSWSGEDIVHDDVKTGTVVKNIFGPVRSKRPVGLYFTGTEFQIKVWNELVSIPEGKTLTYADVARNIGSPKAVRAVGTACGANRIAFLIPCHRVLASSGSLGGYRWGIERKKAILDWEKCR